MVASNLIRRVLTWCLVVLLVISLGWWFVQRDRVPWTIRIATGEPGGVYHQIGESLQASLSRRLRRRVELRTTTGSVDNFRLLQQGKVDLAIVQGGSAPLENAAVITPLYPEWVVVICRRNRDIESVFDLVGRRVAIGEPGSGMRATAARVLDRLQIRLDDITPVELYFKAIVEDDQIDAAIVTTGITNRDLREVLQLREFDVLPVANHRAFGLLEPHFREAEIPKGAFAERPSLPSRDTETVATTAYLTAMPATSDRLVEAALSSIHEENLRLQVPTMLSRPEAPQWVATQMHRSAQHYFTPADDIGLMANVMESLAAGKELLFAIGAGIYLLWRRWSLLRERETQAAISKQKEHLDIFLEETLRIEAEQLQEHDQSKLQDLLKEVTDIKLRVLHEFTEEELRGDQAFRIFLSQCANLISEIQWRIASLPKEASSNPQDSG